MVSALAGASAGSVANSWNLTVSAFVASGLVFISSLFLGFNFDLTSPLGISVQLMSFILVSSACWLVVYNLAKTRISERIKKRGFFKQDAVTVTFLTAGFCLNLGSGLQWFLKLANNLDSVVEFQQILSFGIVTVVSLATTAIPLLNLIVFKRNRIIANYRKSEPNLIKP
jgi:hypothetical protein